MSFDSAKQFQQLWALHMTNGRCVYAQDCDSDCYVKGPNGYIDPNGNPISQEKQTACERKRDAGCDRNRGDVGVGITFISCIDVAVEAVYNYEFSKT